MAVYTRELKVKSCRMYDEVGKTTLEICAALNIRNRAQPQFRLTQCAEEPMSDPLSHTSWVEKQHGNRLRHPIKDEDRIR